MSIMTALANPFPLGRDAIARQAKLIADIIALRTQPSKPIDYDAEYTRLIAEHSRHEMLEAIATLAFALRDEKRSAETQIEKLADLALETGARSTQVERAIADGAALAADPSIDWTGAAPGK